MASRDYSQPEGLPVAESPIETASAPPVGLRQITLYCPEKPLRDPAPYTFLKRLIDIVIALCAIVFLMPLWVVVALWIWIEDRGPIFYVQQRVGRYGVPIPFYKFRSMRVNAEALRAQLLSQSDAQGVAFKMKDDPRVTKIGKFIRKFSIDEAPQLFCVVAGYMSIVGPRPLPLIEGYACDPVQSQRYLLKPGLLCFREVGGRSNLTFEQWMDLDLEYFRTRSLAVDCMIILKAVPAVLRATGAY